MGNPWHIGTLELILRLILSLCLGGIIGYEREVNHHAAGLRTNILVCVGSTLIMLLSIYGFTQFLDEPTVRSDPARLAAQVVSGVGFLGAGTIMQRGASIKGLTTAATLWVMAAIGLAVGAGFYYPAVITCFIVYLSLKILNKVERRFFVSRKIYILRITVFKELENSSELYACLADYKLDIKSINVTNDGDHATALYRINITFNAPKNISWLKLIERLRNFPDVVTVSMEA